jgi:hypothetical protein
MRPALWCLGVFSLAFLWHIVRWRIRRPAAQRAALLRIFGLFLAAFAVAAACFPLLTPLEILHVVVCYVPFSLAYIVLYSAIEADSPSLTMVKFVAAAGPRGRGAEEFERIITDDGLVHARLRAMEAEGMIRREGTALVITPKGLGMARLFSLAARILNLRPGG